MAPAPAPVFRPEAGEAAAASLAPRIAGVLALLFVAFVVFVYGFIRLGWDFDQMAVLFFAMGLLAGVAGASARAARRRRSSTASARWRMRRC